MRNCSFFVFWSVYRHFHFWDKKNFWVAISVKGINSTVSYMYAFNIIYCREIDLCWDYYIFLILIFPYRHYRLFVDWSFQQLFETIMMGQITMKLWPIHRFVMVFTCLALSVFSTIDEYEHQAIDILLKMEILVVIWFTVEFSGRYVS